MQIPVAQIINFKRSARSITKYRWLLTFKIVYNKTEIIDTWRYIDVDFNLLTETYNLTRYFYLSLSIQFYLNIRWEYKLLSFIFNYSYESVRDQEIHPVNRLNRTTDQRDKNK